MTYRQSGPESRVAKAVNAVGMHEPEMAKLIVGNFLRVLSAVQDV